ncbi:MAG TPA: hypothetical protein VL970_09395, partial [Candidatus Acidoferrales bacterium]|nr:hypothetical protein [Candidatus Acidoferrales bacterium]
KPDGIVLARPLWVENNGKRSWQMVEIFWFCRPAAGVRDQDVVAGHADVPEYYCDAQYWTDGKRGGCFGAVDRTGGWRVNFWKGSASDFHPDARFPLEQELSPGKRITADAVPYLWIFANRDVAHWRTVARLGQQTANSILVGTGGD